MSKQIKKVKKTREQWEARITGIWEENEKKGKHVSGRDFNQRKKKIFGNLTKSKKAQNS